LNLAGRSGCADFHPSGSGVGDLLAVVWKVRFFDEEPGPLRPRAISDDIAAELDDLRACLRIGS
jgi:hypothetical protein